MSSLDRPGRRAHPAAPGARGRSHLAAGRAEPRERPGGDVDYIYIYIYIYMYICIRYPLCRS